MIRRLSNEILKSEKISHSNYDSESGDFTFSYTDKYFVSINIPKGYPFYPPKNLTLNYKKIVYYRKGDAEIINKYFNIFCICCVSKLCPNNWNPSIKLEDLIDEYERFKTIINGSLVIRHFIKNNYLNDDIIKIIVGFIKR